MQKDFASRWENKRVNKKKESFSLTPGRAGRETKNPNFRKTNSLSLLPTNQCISNSNEVWKEKAWGTGKRGEKYKKE